jgi:hypothetical protein
LYYYVYMAIDFEGLTPEECSNCVVLQGAILRRRTMLAQCNRIIEGAFFEDGKSDISSAMEKTELVEEEIISELSNFVARCTVVNPVDPNTGCRVPTSEWHDIA